MSKQTRKARRARRGFVGAHPLFKPEYVIVTEPLPAPRATITPALSGFFVITVPDGDSIDATPAGGFERTPIIAWQTDDQSLQSIPIVASNHISPSHNSLILRPDGSVSHGKLGTWRSYMVFESEIREGHRLFKRQLADIQILFPVRPTTREGIAEIWDAFPKPDRIGVLIGAANVKGIARKHMGAAKAESIWNS